MLKEFFRESLNGVIGLSYETIPFWGAATLGYFLFIIWVYYARSKFIAGQEYSLIEIKLPKEINKSPLAMEIVLNALYQTSGETTWINRYIEGKVRPWFSLEMVSIEGSVKFFVWTRKFFKKLIADQIYAQYHGVEIHDADDYTKFVPYGQETDEEWSLWGTEFQFTKEDPYPIKTYVDYGLLNDPKEELKVDPMTAVLEYLGSLGKGEQAWIQILVRASKKNKKPGGLFGFPKNVDWKDEGKRLVDEIIEESKPKEEGKFGRFLTSAEQDLIKALDHSVSKLGFDCGVRGIYTAKKENFNAINIMGLIGSFRQYNTNDLNGFKPMNPTSFDYPWQDFKGKRLSKKKARIFNAYRLRAYFHNAPYPEYLRKPIVLNSEELATIYHFPGGVAQTPTIQKVESKKAEPPVNLPV